MKFKSLVAMGVAGLFAATLASAAPSMTDTGDSINAPQTPNIGTMLAQNDTTSTGDVMSGNSSAPDTTMSGSSAMSGTSSGTNSVDTNSSNSDNNPDTATGDDDY